MTQYGVRRRNPPGQCYTHLCRRNSNARWKCEQSRCIYILELRLYFYNYLGIGKV